MGLRGSHTAKYGGVRTTELLSVRDAATKVTFGTAPFGHNGVPSAGLFGLRSRAGQRE